MKRSEKILLAIFGAVFLVVIGGGVVMYFAKAYNRIAGEKDRLETRLSEMATALSQSADWQKRSEWLEGNTPKFSSHEEASSKLFELAQKEADSSGLKIGAREMIPQRAPVEGEPIGYFDKATVKLSFADVQEEPFYKWLFTLTTAQPKAFVGVTRLMVSPSPAGKSINAEVELTQFYAQNAPAKLTQAR